jgi:hypothetical protein
MAPRFIEGKARRAFRIAALLGLAVLLLALLAGREQIGGERYGTSMISIVLISAQPPSSTPLTIKP